MSKIERFLPNDQYQAALAANSPALGNPFATIADIGTTSNNDYQMFQAFDKGILPQGWTQTTGAPAATNYTQPYETNAVGMIRHTSSGPTALSASIQYASTYNYLLDFSDCVYTKWDSKFSRSPLDVGVMLVGLANRAGSIVPSSFMNVIAVAHDPNNMTTVNPGLTPNLFVWVKNAVGQTLYDTGVAPNGVWQQVNFDYNYSNPMAPYLNVYLDGVLVVTVPGTDLNLFVSQAAGTNAGLKPVCYCGKTVAVSGTNTLKITNFNLTKRWN